MTTKYELAQTMIDTLTSRAQLESIEVPDACEAALILLVQNLKASRGVDYVHGLLRYEIDSLGSGGVFEVQRGGGHS